MFNLKYRLIRLLLYIFIPFIKFPSEKLSYDGLGISTLLCHRDVPYIFYSLASFWVFLEGRLPVYIVNDGTLTHIDKWLIRTFLHVELEEPEEIERYARKIYQPYKEIYLFRFSNSSPILKKKLDAFFLNPFHKTVYVDADILFFNYPSEIISWIKKDMSQYLYTSGLGTISDNCNVQDTHIRCLRKLLYHYVHVDADLYFSSGFLCIPKRSSLLLKQVNWILEHLKKVDYHRDWLTEETIMAILFSKNNAVQLNPHTYTNTWRASHFPITKKKNSIMNHYAHETKKYFGLDALYVCIQQNLFF